MAGMGRKSRYPATHQSIINLVANGCTETAAFRSLGVAEATYYDWKKVHPEFAEEIEKARQRAHATMVGRLVQQAQRGKIAAIIFWLKNRFPEEWRDVHNLVGPTGGPIEIRTQRDRLREILKDPQLRDAAIEIGKRLAAIEIDDLKSK